MKSKVSLVILISLLAMFIPLSMDMYLPALPQMAEQFHTTEMGVNATLTVFYFCMAGGMLLIGPLSDKHGRKKVLVPCAIVYSISSILCALSATLWQLVLFRVFQGITVGGLVALSTAMIKDGFQGQQRENILGISQAMSLLAPVLAPVLGAFVLQFADWRMVFVILSLFGVLAFFLGVKQKESLPEADRVTGSVFSLFTHLGSVAKNKTFAWLMVITAIAPMGYMAYVAASSHMYQAQFCLTETQFSYFYSVNAVVTVIASLSYMKLSAILKPSRFLTGILVTVLISGILVTAFGHLSPYLFALCFIPNSFACTTLKPLSTSMLLKQQERDTGSAAALINFSQTIFSTLALVLGSVAWSPISTGLGGLMVAAVLISLVGWLVLLRKDNSL